MKITDVSVIRYQDPVTSAGTDYGAQIVVVTLTTDANFSGVGFVTGSSISGPLIAQFISSAIAPAMLNQPAGDISRLWDVMVHQVLPRRGGDGLMRYAVAAVDTALWDIKAKAARMPLWQLLGGRRQQVLSYANCAHHLPVDQLAARAESYVAAGHKALKIRGTRSFVTPKEATARVQAVREAIGDDVRLMVDVNGSWDVDTAVTQLKRWQPFDVYWLEEPVPPHDIAGYRRVRQRCGRTLIAGGEQHVGLMEFQVLIDNDCIDVAQPNAAMTGGITDWLRIHAYATSQSVPVSPWNLQQIHIHLAAALNNVQWIEYFMPDNALLEFQGKLLAGSELNEVVEEDGVYLLAPEQPGIGITIDEQVAAESAIQ
ncbi:MAG: mandelate racemase/muconate lactonizing enzyme family protein [Pseudomonadota bacterium]